MARRASSVQFAAKARNHKPSLVRRVADHPLFEAFVYVAIIINAFLLASTAGEEDIKCTTGSYIAELCIFSVYLLELEIPRRASIGTARGAAGVSEVPARAHSGAPHGLLPGPAGFT